MLSPRFRALAGITITAAMSRLIPHPPNFTPIGALALFSGAHFPTLRAALAVSLGSMLLSDAVLALLIYGKRAFLLTPFVYASFALSAGLGHAIRAKRRPAAIAGMVVASSVLFYLISNFGDWLLMGLYPPTLEGLLACYVAAIPYFHTTLIANALFTGLMFWGFELAQRRFPVLRQRPACRDKELFFRAARMTFPTFPRQHEPCGLRSSQAQRSALTRLRMRFSIEGSTISILTAKQ